MDELAAGVVKQIFQLCIEGYGPTQIAKKLENDKVLTPSAYFKEIGLYPAALNTEKPYAWVPRTVADILDRQEYLKYTVNFKTGKKSYKLKNTIKNDPSEWQVFKDTHETIISEDTFQTVKRIRDGRCRPTPLGEMPVLSGMVFCADCGSKLYQVKGKGWSHDKEYTVCANYRKRGKDTCTSHQIRNVDIESVLLYMIQQVTAFARDHEDEFIELVIKSNAKSVEREIRESKKEFEQAQARISKLDTIIQRLYEDNIEGKISDERFMKMSATYEAEQNQLTERVAELEQIIDATRENLPMQTASYDWLRFTQISRN